MPGTVYPPRATSPPRVGSNPAARRASHVVVVPPATPEGGQKRRKSMHRPSVMQEAPLPLPGEAASSSLGADDRPAVPEELMSPEWRQIKRVLQKVYKGLEASLDEPPEGPKVGEDLLRFETVWAAAGNPHAVFGVAPTALITATGALVTRLAAG